MAIDQQIEVFQNGSVKQQQHGERIEPPYRKSSVHLGKN
jgi:hypothetical protein